MKDLLPIILPALGSVIVALLSALSVQINRWIASKTKNEKLAGLFSRIDDAVFVAIKEVAQLSVDAARQAAVDGKLPAEIAAAAKTAAIASARSHLGPKGIRELIEIVGIPAESVDAFLGSRVEAGVAELKSP